MFISEVRANELRGTEPAPFLDFIPGPFYCGDPNKDIFKSAVKVKTEYDKKFLGTKEKENASKNIHTQNQHIDNKTSTKEITTFPYKCLLASTSIKKISVHL
jgi:hypothetical protein